VKFQPLVLPAFIRAANVEDLTVATPHPALSPEERVSVSDSFEDSMIASFGPATGGSIGTLMRDAFAESTAAIVQRRTHTIPQKGASVTPSSGRDFPQAKLGALSSRTTVRS